MRKKKQKITIALNFFEMAKIMYKPKESSLILTPIEVTLYRMTVNQGKNMGLYVPYFVTENGFTHIISIQFTIGLDIYSFKPEFIHPRELKPTVEMMMEQVLNER